MRVDSGLGSVLSTALTGLSSNQQALRTTSNNIANANTVGFVRQAVRFETRTSGGQVAGVEVGEVQRAVDSFLEGAARSSISQAERYAAETRIHDRLQTLLGRPDENTSLSGRLDDLFIGIGNLVLDPSAPARRQTALSSIEDFATEVNRLAKELQTLRADASARISEDVTKLNSLLKTVGEINPIVIREKALGVDIGGLEEQRASALKQIAEIIDIRVTENSNGSVRVATSTGVALLDTARFELRFNPPGTVLAETKFEPITLHRVDPVTGLADANGAILDRNIKSGSLRGLLDVRDRVLPDLSLTVGELSSQVIDQLNGVHNANTAVPPPNGLVGRNVGLLGTDRHGFSGAATFTVLAADGTLANSFTMDFDAIPATDTIANVIAAVNAGLAGAASLSLVNGSLSYTAANSANGVAIVQGATAATTPSARAGRGFAHFFGMNDLLGAQVPAQFETGFSTTDGHGFTAGGSLDLDLMGADGTVLASHILTISGTSFNDLLNNLNQPANLGAFATFSMDAKGALVITPKTGFKDLKVFVNDDTTSRGSTGMSLSNLFGIGDSFRINAARGVGLASAVAGNAQRFSLARVDLAAPVGMPAVNSGDAGGATALEDLFNTTVGFKAAGQLTAVTTTLGRYAANVLSNAALLAQRADDLKSNSDALKGEITKRIANVSGVNMDEELANMVVFQNAFNASARLITTAREMFDVLLRVLR